MEDSGAFFRSLFSSIISAKSTKNYIKFLVDFSSNEENIKLFPKYFSQVNPLLTSSSSRIIFIYLKDLETNRFEDDELIKAISLITSLKDNYLTLYEELSKEMKCEIPNVNVLREGFFDTDFKFKYILKYANSKSFNGISEIISSENTPIDFKEFIITLVMLVNNDITGAVSKLIKTTEFYDVLMHIYSYTIPTGEHGNSTRRWLSTKVADLITKCVTVENFDHGLNLDFTEYDLDKIEFLTSSIASLNKQIKAKSKLSYEPSKKEITEETELLEDELEVNEIQTPQNTIVSTSIQLESISELSVLLLKADDLKLSKLPSNFRVEVVSKVDDSVLSSNEFDVVMVLTKALKHKDFYRIKSNICCKLILSSSTNRGRIISDLFYGM